jgi:hypothetical protein
MHFDGWMKGVYFRAYSPEELKDIIADELGNDIGAAVQELIDKANLEQQRVDSNVKYYESLADNLASVLNDIKLLSEDMVEYLDETKRMDRQKIKQAFESIIKSVHDNI